MAEKSYWLWQAKLEAVVGEPVPEENINEKKFRKGGKTMIKIGGKAPDFEASGVS